MDIDRAGLAEFLRLRREALQPEDVGLPRSLRRRTAGLRREEVAVLSHMSTDYYTRLEQQRGPHPSPEMLAAIAHGLHLSRAERDHLFRLGGHRPTERGASDDHVSPGLLRIIDRLEDTPAEIVTELGETLRQSRLGVALTGDLTRFRGFSRAIGFRWFTDTQTRELYAPSDRDHLSRLWVSGLRSVATRRGRDSKAAAMAAELRESSPEFRTLWDTHEIGVRPQEIKHFVHPEVGVLELRCQQLVDPEQSHALLVYTADPGTESYERLTLLGVVGAAGV